MITETEFPVVWDNAEDAAAWWERDTMHNPGQTSPLAYAWEEAVFSVGFARACQAMRLPVSGWESRYFNTYSFTRMVRRQGTPEEMQALSAAADDAMKAAIARLGDAWHTQQLPEILRHIDELASQSYDDMTGPELASVVDDLVSRFHRLWEIHFRIVMPAYRAISEFDEFFREIFEPDDPHAVYRLLAGLPNKTVESGSALWTLSRAARRSPEVLEALASPDALTLLAATDAGRTFLRELDVYLETFGHRGDLWGLEHCAWIEDPSPVLRTVAEYASQPEDCDPALTTTRLAAEREQAVDAARRRLAVYPSAVREQFESMLTAAQMGTILTEDHGFYIDFRAHYEVRRALCATGRYLAAAGAIPDEEAVFMLTLDELSAALRESIPADRSALVAERRAEMARFAGIDAPLGIGTPPAPPKADAGGPAPNTTQRAMSKFFGAPPVDSGVPGLVNGTPGSPGKAVGVARVLSSVAESGRIRHGDILVATTTAPPWTPLFATVAAVVTDTGGVLSHCAIVAREYGIPAVVGTQVATRRIREGQIIEVDGTAGTVRFQEDA